MEEMVEAYVSDPEREFRLRPSVILDLNRLAIDELDAFAGNWRPGSVMISGSKHQPPAAHLVPGLVEQMCDYVNDNWAMRATHLAAYVMWRMNWIHAFTDGNGRTARAVSYLVLSIRLRMKIPGTPTIPEMIIDNREPYYEALEQADQSLDKGAVDLSKMERLLESLLARQLLTVVSEASGKAY
ncbi:Fic family protein [Hyphomicrobium sp.]|uniref:Fic family protein n=1 Tax=Hyphomicrobium sp. TaxID=82 RepID=UPI002CE3244B|nr:Fic family protein [Hyphomicrobium sp.]HVZ05483.1 Fic family protein [Hyphomicrobium sp.]